MPPAAAVAAQCVSILLCYLLTRRGRAGPPRHPQRAMCVSWGLHHHAQRIVAGAALHVGVVRVCTHGDGEGVGATPATIAAPCSSSFAIPSSPKAGVVLGPPRRIWHAC